jgi:hypothetical protein
MKTSKLKKRKRMFSGSFLTSKLYKKIIKMKSKSHETIPLKGEHFEILVQQLTGAVVNDQSGNILVTHGGCWSAGFR